MLAITIINTIIWLLEIISVEKRFRFLEKTINVANVSNLFHYLQEIYSKFKNFKMIRK